MLGRAKQSSFANPKLTVDGIKNPAAVEVGSLLYPTTTGVIIVPTQTMHYC